MNDEIEAPGKMVSALVEAMCKLIDRHDFKLIINRNKIMARHKSRAVIDGSEVTITAFATFDSRFVERNDEPQIGIAVTSPEEAYSELEKFVKKHKKDAKL